MLSLNVLQLTWLFLIFLYPFSRCTNDVLSSSKVSRRHSFALTSPTTSDPPSLDDVDLGNSKHGTVSPVSRGFFVTLPNSFFVCLLSFRYCP